MNLFQLAHQAIISKNIQDKLFAASFLHQAMSDGFFEYLDEQSYICPVLDIENAGLPDTVKQVPRSELIARKLSTPMGKAAFVHAIAHIEFNAVNLALDACYRFRGMPKQYYIDWLRIAKEEAYHFELLHQELKVLGYQYGDFPVINDLWKMAHRTSHDVLIRMALVPRVLEARGLDVTPGIIEKFAAKGDTKMVSILQVILRDEIEHVRAGNTWYKNLCEQRGYDTLSMFEKLLKEYAPSYLRGPFAMDYRQQAGFEENELEYFCQLIKEEV